MSPFTTTDFLRTSWAMWRMTTEAQAVMAMRLAGLAGFWALPPGESRRMVDEKSHAFTDSWMAGGRAMAGGATAGATVGAAMAPFSRRVSANRRRLYKS